MMPLCAPIRPLDRLAARLADLRLGDGLTSVSLPLPELANVALPVGLPDAWSWRRPAEGLALIGCGEALRRDRCELNGLPWRHDDPDHCGEEPMAFLGHGFGGDDPAELPPALLRVPRLLLRRRAGRTVLVFSHDGGGDPRSSWLDAAAGLLDALSRPMPPLAEGEVQRIAEYPSSPAFEDRVRAATQAIADGRVEKVVLSRRVTVAGQRAFDPARLAAALAARHPSCAILTAAFGARTLVAASPERLVARQGGRIESHALAGTAPLDPADPFLGRRLLASAKDRHEHRLVVGWIAEALAGLCDGLDIPSEPRLMSLGPLQHLWTPISGSLRPGADMLTAARRLHPTPAVAGLPLAAARQLLAELGESRSGWYSGAMGWIDRAGDGEMSVVLRCALLDGDRAEVSAGAGIVAGSDPAAELAETELKLRAMLDSLRVA